MAEIYMDSKFLLKRGDAARWEELNLVLERGEPGFVVDEGRLKVGDGVTAWNDLPYIGESNIFNVKNHYAFPNVGRPNVLYKAEDEGLLYQWNTTTMTYDVLNKSGESEVLDIKVIYGGDAAGIE